MLCYLQMIENEDDRSKFERIYLTYRALMFHVAMGIVHNEADAEDAVHQAFLSVIESLQKISAAECPKTRAYVVIIVERKAIDILRQRTMHGTVSFEDANCGVEIALPGGHGLADAITRLPVRYREVLLLRYYNGFTVREIAKILDMKKDAVQKSLWRAKLALQKEMEGGGKDDNDNFEGKSVRSVKADS